MVVLQAFRCRDLDQSCDPELALKSFKPGMELAGLVMGVVGVLPVILDVVEGYHIIVDVAHVKRYMADLGRDIETEMVILQNTYERLLDGIVPAWELEALTKVEPQTSKWKIYDRQIRDRLQNSFDDFLKRTEDMQNAVSELQKKLVIDDKGKVSLFKPQKFFVYTFTVTPGTQNPPTST